jgi:general secretion pathway protein N
MNIHQLIGWLILAASTVVTSEAAAQTRNAAMQAALDTNTLQGGVSSASPDPIPGAITPAGIDPVQEVGKPRNAARSGREPRGNPLWAIPLKSLSATRERPIFLPSRRPFAPAVAGPPPAPPPPPPPAPADPERPRLALVGAVVGDSEGIAIFFDQTNQGIVRLRTGENHLGWILRSVRGREATLEKGRETVLLALPAPTDAAAAPGAPGLVPGFPAMRGGLVPPGVPHDLRVPGAKEPEL